MSESDTPLHAIHLILEDHFGPLHWWPAQSPFEVVVGAILTQNTAWRNVELAIANLRQADALTIEALAQMERGPLELLIRPAGFFRQKAERLQWLAQHLAAEWNADVALFCAGELEETRRRLLSHKGIGPETADSILLYAAQRPTFVVDAYTRRIFARLGLLAGDESYEAIRLLFTQQLPEEVALYNEYHAQIVNLAKSCCHKNRPLCSHCPLVSRCSHATAEKQRTK